MMRGCSGFVAQLCVGVVEDARTAAMTVPIRSPKCRVSVIRHAVSAVDPVSPLRKYKARKSQREMFARSRPSRERSGAKPNNSVKVDVQSRPNATAVRVPSRLMIAGATSDVSAMPHG